MTYSIIGRCARTGRMGLGITTFSLAVGGRCEGVAANVGVCKTKAFPNRTNDPLGIRLMAEGYAPSRVVALFAAGLVAGSLVSLAGVRAFAVWANRGPSTPAPPHFVEEAATAGVTHVYDGEFTFFVGGGVAAR